MRHERSNEFVAFLFVRCPHEPLKHIANLVGRAMLRMLLAELFAQPNVSVVVSDGVNGL